MGTSIVSGFPKQAPKNKKKVSLKNRRTLPQTQLACILHEAPRPLGRCGVAAAPQNPSASGIGTSSRSFGCGSKPVGSHFGVGEFTTHFRTYFGGWIGMFTGGTIWVLTYGRFDVDPSLIQNPVSMRGSPRKEKGTPLKKGPFDEQLGGLPIRGRQNCSNCWATRNGF